MDNQATAKASGCTERDSMVRRMLEFLWLLWTDAGQRTFKFNFLFLFCLFAVCGATICIGAVPTQVGGYDNFFLLDNGWRIVCGQRPHLDFFSPWGPITFLVVGMGLKLSDTAASGIGYGTAAVGLIIGLWALWLTRGRLIFGPRFLFCFYIVLLATAPYPLGFLPHENSHAMMYNRYGYALLGLVLVECFMPGEGERRDAGEMLGGLSTGAIAAIALFLKASYFAIALPLIGASFIFHRYNYKRFLGLALGFSVILFALLAYLRFEIRTVTEALWMAAGARSEALNWPILGIQLMSQVPLLLAAVAILVYGIPRERTGGAWFRDRKWLIWTILIFVSDSILMISNMQMRAMPLLSAFAILIVNDMTAERMQLTPAEALSERSRHIFILAVCFLMVTIQLASDLLGLANGIYQRANPLADQARFSEPHVASLILYDGDPHRSGNGHVYTNYVNDGVALLRKHCDASDRVLTMDHVNPFPYVLKWEPPRGGIAAIAFNFTLSAKYRPSFDAFFGDASVVLMPKRPAQSPFFIDGFYELYTPALIERYRLYAESDWFWLYKRK